MSDLLLELSQNPQFRKLVKTTGLPLPMPPVRPTVKVVITKNSENAYEPSDQYH